jgi:predicted ribosome quality control (RQC) complex YloA/Tae2 family protein
MQHGLDRTAIMEFAGTEPTPQEGYQLIAELFGHQPNLILVEKGTGQIVEAVRHFQGPDGRTIAPRQPYQAPNAAARPDPRLLHTVEAISAVLHPHLHAGLTPAVALHQTFTGLTNLWEHEVPARADNGSPAALAQALLDIIHRIETGPWDPCLILDGSGRPVGTSPLRLRHVPEERQQLCTSLGEMVERYARHMRQQHTFVKRQNILRQVLRRIELRLRSRRVKLVAESQEFSRADLLRRMGEILVAHQAHVPRGAPQVTLPDHAEGVTGGATGGAEAVITIPLDPRLSPGANAERLFKAARRGRRGAIRVAARLAQTDLELVHLHAWSERVAAAINLKTMDAIRKEMEETPGLLAQKDKMDLHGYPEAEPGESGRAPARQAPKAKRDGPSPHRQETGLEPRRFVSSDGLPILVGRDTRGNDYLTLHLAKSQDLWLHVQEFPGSHVVIRAPNRSGNIPRRTLIQAAQLAAYYSQARSHGKVAVDYTLRKYVHKPKKVKPGLVTISQEKTIVVSPDKSLIQKLAPSDG